MFEALKSAITSDAGSVTIAFSIFWCLIMACWHLSKFHSKFTTIDKLENNIDIIKGDISEIKAWISISKANSSPFAQAHSPISLTEKGISVEKNLKIGESVAINWETIHSKVKALLNEQSNPYDVQIASFKIGSEFKDYISLEKFNELKVHAFETGVDIENYGIIFGIIIRNKMLELLNYHSDDVDKHDPTKSKK